MKKIVIFGGGTGLSNLLRGLKKLPYEIIVVVAITDDGGSTGKIRDYYEIPAPGDLRRAVVALTDNDEVRELMNYRFDEKIENHTIGNLILTAFTDIKGDMSKAVRAYCRLLDVKEKIIPISNECIDLLALMENDTIILGETKISKDKKKIKQLFIDKKHKVNQEVVKEISQADAVIFGCGSLYTSIIANIIFEDVKMALCKKNLKKIYISNLVTQDNETINYTLNDHITAINNHLIYSEIDACFANENFNISDELLKKYSNENQKFVKIDYVKTKLILNDYLCINSKNHIRHDYDKVATDIDNYLKGEI